MSVFDVWPYMGHANTNLYMASWILFLQTQELVSDISSHFSVQGPH